MQQIGFDWQAAVDVLVEVSSKQAYESSLALIRAGFLVGPSSGMALQGLFLHLAELKALGQLSSFSKKPMAAVVICPDGPYPYLDEYFTYCDAELFPEVRVARMDLDTTRTRNAYERLITEFGSGRTHVLIDTQMVTKG